GFFAYREHVSKLSSLKEKFPDKEAIDAVAALEAGKAGKTDDEKKKIDEEIEKATKEWKKSPASKRVDEINAELEKKAPGIAKAKDEYFVGAKPEEATAGAAFKYNEAVNEAFKEATKKDKDEAKIKETAKALEDAKNAKAEKEKEYQKLAGEAGVLEKEKKDLLDEIANLTKQEGISKGFFEKEKGPLSQFWIQVKASLFSMIFAFVLSLILAVIVQAGTMGNFSTDKKSEVEGLDLTEHGEVGFDLATGYDSMPIGAGAEPRTAKVPPAQKRFAVVVEGVENGGLIKAWSELCQPSSDPIDADFKAVYPYVTTIQGNRFQLRGGEPAKLSVHLQKLFSKKLGKQLKVRVEE
ncbi:MAG: ammonium transporter, partial [Planctomycetes bacterium]|nr:ammonium transporter [Planctomycetota bacterium]